MAAKFFCIFVSALLVQSITAYPSCGCGQSAASRAAAVAGAEITAAEIAAANNAINNAKAFNNVNAINNVKAISNVNAINNAKAFNNANAINTANAINAANAVNLGYGKPYGSSPIYTNPSITSTNGGSFSVSLNSPYGPYGINIVSENTIEGLLEVVGSLPIIATVNLDGSVPSTGAAGTSYSCGNGNVGISSESLAAAGFGVGSAIANDVARAEIAGAQLTNAAGYGAALANAELAAANAVYSKPRYGSAGLNAAGLANINAGLAGSSSRLAGCGCNY